MHANMQYTPCVHIFPPVFHYSILYHSGLSSETSVQCSRVYNKRFMHGVVCSIILYMIVCIYVLVSPFLVHCQMMVGFAVIDEE